MATAADIRVSIGYQTRFGLRLAAALSSPPPSPASNSAFSPLSLHVALSLLAAGAGGATRDQLAAALGGDAPAGADGLHALAEQVVQLVLADGSGAGGPRVAFADGVFVDSSLKLKPAFEEVAVGKYRADTQSVDFQKKVDLIPFLPSSLTLAYFYRDV
jgi:serpin B